MEFYLHSSCMSFRGGELDLSMSFQMRPRVVWNVVIKVSEEATASIFRIQE
jgi:hypothetical protein